MEIFPNAQGQLPLQSMVGSGRILNSTAIFRLSSLPAKLKKIRSKIKALEWPHDNLFVFLAVSEVSGHILQKFELIQVFMQVLVTCKNEEDKIKNYFARVATKFLPL